MKTTEHLLFIFLLVQPALTEIFTATAIIAGSVALGYKYGEKMLLNTYCKKYECCHESLIPTNLLSLEDKLNSKLFGQHIVQEKLFKALASHYENIEKSKKPLVMTFNGMPGTGKNYVSTMIAESVFMKGINSDYFHLFHGSQFADKDQILAHKESIKKEIYDGVTNCPYSIFVFDEVDKMPAGVFESITSMLDHHSLVKGKDLKKAVFIFLTNSGGEEISFILHKLTHMNTIYRHETKLHHFEELMKVGVFNQIGGLKDSSLVKKAVIDFYLPFLPLEVQHVSQCIVEEFKDCGRYEVTQKMIDDILQNIGFHSITFYAHAGCKSIYGKVQAECYF